MWLNISIDASLIKFIQRARYRRLREQRPTSSMAKTLVFAISMSEPTSGFINRVSVWSRNNIPRTLTLIWPKASCTTTCCPIHHSNAFCILPTALFRGQAAWATASPTDTVKSYSWLPVRNRPGRYGARCIQIWMSARHLHKVLVNKQEKRFRECEPSLH